MVQTKCPFLALKGIENNLTEESWTCMGEDCQLFSRTAGECMFRVVGKASEIYLSGLKNRQEEKDLVMLKDRSARMNEDEKLESAEIFFSQGEKALKHGQIEAALHSFKKTLSLSPGHARAIAGLGTAYSYLGRHDEAVIHFKQALSIYPDNPEVALELLKEYRKLYHDYSEREKMFNRIAGRMRIILWLIFPLVMRCACYIPAPLRFSRSSAHGQRKRSRLQLRLTPLLPGLTGV